MSSITRIDRRAFLTSTAALTTGAMLTACGANKQAAMQGHTPTPVGTPSATKPAVGVTSPTSPSMAVATRVPATTAATGAPMPPGAGIIGITFNKPIEPIRYSGKYHESPDLAKLVKAGKLPPVEQRLPEHPYVVPHPWVTQGKYGGVVRHVCSDTSSWSTTHLQQESMCGHTPLRWLRDGQEVGPGLAESWESNEQTTEWTFHFRKGLRWSDGVPWTVDDILFWWEDEANNHDLYPAGGVPPDFISSKGTPAKFRKLDLYTLQISFYTPSPLVAEQAACYVKRGAGTADWMDCKHYMKQFHIKYNKKLNPKTWVTQYGVKHRTGRPTPTTPS